MRTYRNFLLKILVSLSLLLVFDSLILERYLVRFPEYDFVSEQIPEDFDGYRIAILSDLHLGFLDPEIWIQWVIHETNDKNPDMIVGLGDYVKKRNNKEELIRVWPLLLTLKAKDNVFFVNGNHDHWANDKLALKLLEASQKSLRNQSKTIYRQNSQITIAGLGDLWTDEVNIDHALSAARVSNFKLMLTHNPDASETKHKTKVNLYLAGHTHGGQVRIPFLDYSPVLPIQSRYLDKGFRKNKFNEDVFVSAGIGWSILPIRFYCPSEVPIITLRSRKPMKE